VFTPHAARSGEVLRCGSGRQGGLLHDIEKGVVDMRVELGAAKLGDLGQSGVLGPGGLISSATISQSPSPPHSIHRGIEGLRQAWVDRTQATNPRQ
jgi:hypothetical protein